MKIENRYDTKNETNLFKSDRGALSAKDERER